MKTTRRAQTWLWLPRSLRGKAVLVLSAMAGLAAVTLGIVAFSVWTEARFPADECDPGSLVSQVRTVTTQPVVAAVSHQLERHIRTKLSGQWLATQISEEETITRFLSPSTPYGERRMLAVRLARLGTPETIAALLEAFEKAEPDQQAVLAELLGSTGISELKPRLLPLLESADERLVVAGIRGLSALGGEEISGKLAGLLVDQGRAQTVRIEAAQALGTLATTSARDALVSVLDFDATNELTPIVLRSLGTLPFARVAEVFTQYLDTPDAPPELRTTAVEALAFSTKEAVPFLLNTAARDADPEVRASAAWAISTHESALRIGSTLAAIATREDEPDVRRRLYEALTPQPDIPAANLLPDILAETDISARIAGFNALASAIGQTGDAAVGAVFDRQIVPELQRVAANENTLNIRLRAVIALRRANTPSAQAALAVLATSSSTQVAAASRAGLSAQSAANTMKGVMP